MGCDIHFVVEKKVNDKWVGVYTTDCQPRTKPLDVWSFAVAESRNYKRFGALANVRGDGPNPKGAPNDMSDLAAMSLDFWRDSGHSVTWEYLKDAIAIFEMTTPIASCELERVSPEDWFGLDPERETEARVIFWFDN